MSKIKIKNIERKKEPVEQSVIDKIQSELSFRSQTQNPPGSKNLKDILFPQIDLTKDKN